MEELTERCSINGRERGSEEWVREVNTWVEANPQPTCLVELENGELGAIEYGDRIIETRIFSGRSHADDVFAAANANKF